MCHAYFYHHQTCGHTSVLLHNLCQPAVNRGREPCRLPLGSQAQCITCDERSPHCIGTTKVRADGDRADLETLYEGSNSEESDLEGSDSEGGEQARQQRHADSQAPPAPVEQASGVGSALRQEPQRDFAIIDVPGQYSSGSHANVEDMNPGLARVRPEGHSINDARSSLPGIEDGDDADRDNDDDAKAATNPQASAWSHKRNATSNEWLSQEDVQEDHDARKEVKKARREAELDEARLLVVLQASLHEIDLEESARAMTSDDYEQQVLEHVKRLSLQEARAGRHFAEQIVFAEAMGLPPGDEESMLHEVKKASILGLAEERRHAAMASVRQPNRY